MRSLSLILAVVFAGCATTLGSARPGMRDAEGYAIASCLAKQKDLFLRQQGDGWASVVIARGNVDLERLRLVDDKVREAVAGRQMLVVRDESSPSGDATLPVLYCMEILGEAMVRDAIDQAVP